MQTVQDGSRFDESTNEPESWQTPLADTRVHEWSRRWLSEPATEALARFISITVDAGAKPPAGLRVYLHTALAPGTDSGHNVLHKRWMDKHCVTLGELDRERVADIDRKLGLKLDGSQLAANTTSRIRIGAPASVQSAIDAGAVATDAWPQRSKTRARRKVARTKRSVDVRSFPSPGVMAEAIDAIVTQQPASRTYRVMTAVACYAGLRPSEVVMLRARSAELPTQGWGRLDVTEADISFTRIRDLPHSRAIGRSRLNQSVSGRSGVFLARPSLRRSEELIELSLYVPTSVSSCFGTVGYRSVLSSSSSSV